MKKLVSLVILIVMYFTLVALSESIDLSQLSDDELLELKQLLEEEIKSRKIPFSYYLEPGEYNVGRDVAPGIYKITFVEDLDADWPFKWVYVYNSYYDLGQRGKDIWSAYSQVGPYPIYTRELYEGQWIIVKYASANFEYFGSGK